MYGYASEKGLKKILGAHLSSRCLSIDGSSSKFWSILRYPKRHEPSLDIWFTNRFDTLVILFWRHIPYTLGWGFPRGSFSRLKSPERNFANENDTLLWLLEPSPNTLSILRTVSNAYNGSLRHLTFKPLTNCLTKY